MAHESDAATKVYERDGDSSKQADTAARALNRQYLKSRVHFREWCPGAGCN
jgi:hypothetical protein